MCIFFLQFLNSSNRIQFIFGSIDAAVSINKDSYKTINIQDLLKFYIK